MVRTFIKNGSSFLLKTQKTIISAAAVIALAYGFSAFLGLLRSRLLAHYFGASEELGIFYTADKIPSFIYSILVVGTLSTVFIPIFTGLLNKDEEAAWQTASSMVTVSIFMFLIFGSLVYVFSPLIIKILSVGKFNEDEILLGSTLMRIMLFAQFILIVSSFVTSVLQSFRFFIVPALAPVLYNLGMIFGIIFLVPKVGIYGPAIGVIFGAAFHLLIQVPLLSRIKFDFSFSFNFKNRGMKEIFTLMPPRIFGSAVAQISAIVNNSLAILVSTSSVVVFKFADQLQSFPVNLFGASIALAALPTLSMESETEDSEKFKRTFLTSFHQMLFLVVPASVILLVLRVPVVRLVYGASRFPWEATVLTSYTLAFFSLSVFAQSGIYLLNRAFFALRDTLTPVKVNFFTLMVSISLSVTFIKFLGWGVWSIALSYSVAAILDLLILLYLLHRKVGGFDINALLVPFTKISYSAVLMGISLYLPMKLLDEVIFDTTRTINLVFLTVIATFAGIVSYLFFTWAFKVKEIRLLYRIFYRFRPSSGLQAASDITSDVTQRPSS